MALVPASNRGVDPSANVDSVFGRTGVVVAVAGDYTAAQVTNAFDKSAAQTLANNVTLNGTQTTVNGVVRVNTSGGNQILLNGGASAVWATGLLSDAVNRFDMLNDGTLQLGDGTNPSDVNLSRRAAGVWGSTSVVFQQSGLKTGAITSGALPTVSPSSGTAFQCLTTRDVYLVVPATLTNANGTVLIELSPDNVTFSTLNTIAPAVNAAVVSIALQVPAAWRVKLTATNVTLGTGTYY